MKPVGSKKIIARILRLRTSSNCSQLIGNCPACNSRLSINVKNDGTLGGLVTCMRCKQIYRFEAEKHSIRQGQNPCGYCLSYVVVGPWRVSAIMEYLFDNVGPIKQVTGGFVCQPDEYHPDFPFITVNQVARTVRLDLFGQYQECQAVPIIHQVVSEIGNRFQLDLYPLILEQWEYQNETQGFVLIEQRQFATLVGQRREVQT